MFCVKLRLFSRSRSQWRFKFLLNLYVVCISYLLYHWSHGNQTGCVELLYLIAKQVQQSGHLLKQFYLQNCWARSGWVGRGYFAVQGRKPCFSRNKVNLLWIVGNNVEATGSVYRIAIQGSEVKILNAESYYSAVCSASKINFFPSPSLRFWFVVVTAFKFSLQFKSFFLVRDKTFIC